MNQGRQSTASAFFNSLLGQRIRRPCAQRDRSVDRSLVPALYPLSRSRPRRAN